MTLPESELKSEFTNSENPTSGQQSKPAKLPGYRVALCQRTLAVRNALPQVTGKGIAPLWNAGTKTPSGTPAQRKSTGVTPLSSPGKCWVISSSGVPGAPLPLPEPGEAALAGGGSGTAAEASPAPAPSPPNRPRRGAATRGCLGTDRPWARRGPAWGARSAAAGTPSALRGSWGTCPPPPRRTAPPPAATAPGRRGSRRRPSRTPATAAGGPSAAGRGPSAGPGGGSAAPARRPRSSSAAAAAAAPPRPSPRGPRGSAGPRARRGQGRQRGRARSPGRAGGPGSAAPLPLGPAGCPRWSLRWASLRCGPCRARQHGQVSARHPGEGRAAPREMRTRGVGLLRTNRVQRANRAGGTKPLNTAGCTLMHGVPRFWIS